ncbi:hypothetical protein Trydic_g8453 [Trypoxylus dichotomus]
MFYGFLKSIRHEKVEDAQNYIQSKSGDTVTENRAIMDRWKEHFHLNQEVEEENTNEQQSFQAFNTGRRQNVLENKDDDRYAGTTVREYQILIVRAL